jgi:hypothetical protein
MRRMAMLVCLAAAWAGLAGEPAPRQFVQAVEFPYYAYPRQLWERELVWLRTIGIRTVAFSIPAHWHQPDAGEPDFTGRTSPRRDLAGLIRLLRRAGLRAWIRPQPPGGALAQRHWLKQLEALLATQTEKHGGPVEFVEGKGLVIDVPAPPAPVTTVAATDAGTLIASRAAIAAARGALLWERVEDEVPPAGWEGGRAVLVRRGAVALGGEEGPATAALRRQAALLREWGAVLPEMQPGPAVKPAAGQFPAGVRAAQLVGRSASAVSLVNAGTQPFQDDLRVLEPVSGKTLVVPGVKIPPGQVLWLPVGVSLGIGGMCRQCSQFSGAETMVYATAELHALEFENGILSMEFSAPVAGEVVLQLARHASGPYLAAGHPTTFDWDEKNLRARLPVPAGTGPGFRVRVGLGIAPPDSSAFFADARRLISGVANIVSTSYSSAELAARSRLRAPEGFATRAVAKSATGIDYEVMVPPDALHGSWADLAIEADGGLLGRARLQIFRPVSVRWTEAVRLHFGARTDITVEPLTATADPRAGRNFEIVIRNNSAQIQTYRVEAAGEGLEFFPARSEISIGAILERPVSLRVFSKAGGSGLRPWRLGVTGGGAKLDLPMRLLLVPRGETVVWSADLDGDGADEAVIENQRIRAVFSTREGGRWLEFVWKDTGLNLLSDGGALAGTGVAAARAAGDHLELAGSSWKRTVRLAGQTLTVEQDTPLAGEVPTSGKRDGITLEVTREGARRAVYTLQ